MIVRAHWMQMVAMLVVLCIFTMLAPDVLAAQNPSSSGASPSKCSEYVGLANRIAGCVRDTLTFAGDKFFNPQTGVYSLVSRAITALFTLGVVIFGVMAAAGMIERPARDTFMLLIKISMIAFFTANVDWGYRQVLTMMDATGQAVVSFVPQSGGNSQSLINQSICLQNMRNAQGNARAVTGPWLGLDCVIDSVIGIRVETNAGTKTSATLGGLANGSSGSGNSAASEYFNKKLNSDDKGPSRGLMNFFFSTLKTSVLGAMIAIIGLIFMYGLLQLIVKSLFIYLAGYLGITLLMIIAPLFIPLVLFRETKPYFDKWARMLLSFVLQPIIILIFISFTIVAVDLAVFSGDYSVMYRIAGNASRVDGFSLNTYLDEKKVIHKTTAELLLAKTGATKIPTDLASGEAIFKNLPVTKCIPALMGKDAKLKEDCTKEMYPITSSIDTVDWQKLADARNPAVAAASSGGSGGAQGTTGQQISREVLAAILFAGIVVFVMNGLLAVIPNVANDLLGDFRQSPNLGSVGGVLPWQKGAH